MNLFMQGMRRSGTTIIFDILSQDERLDLYYEPFSAGKKGVLGGGSGIQQIDLMEKIRDLRRAFVASYPRPLEESDLNYGAPRDPRLELEAELPDHCRDYLAVMMSRSNHTVFKFTRMYRKVFELKRLDPKAYFLLLVRHPQEVVASYMYGRDQQRLSRFPTRESFFTTKNEANPWNGRKFFEAIVLEQGREHLADVPNWMRYLVLWKYTFEHAYRDGRAAFGNAFIILRYEDLALDPGGTIMRLYEHIDLPPSERTVAWAAVNVRQILKECYEDDPRWEEAYERLELNGSLAAVGYGPRR